MSSDCLSVRPLVSCGRCRLSSGEAATEESAGVVDWLDGNRFYRTGFLPTGINVYSFVCCIFERWYSDLPSGGLESVVAVPLESLTKYHGR